MKKKILILGYSSFLQRRVIKSLLKIKNIDIYICSKSYKIDKKKRIFFNDYLKAIKANNYHLVYISLINNLHYKYARLALKNNNNLVIDKPITTKFLHTKKLLKLAKQKKLLLCELTIFNEHRIFKKIYKFFGGLKNIEHIRTTFNVPLSNKNSYLEKIQKGANQDLGPYAAAFDRIFFNKIKKKKIFLKKIEKKRLITGFSLSIISKKKNYFGEFSIQKPYQSKILFYSKSKSAEIDFKAFALPTDKKIKLKVKSKLSSSNFDIKDDYIKRFFKNLIVSNHSKSNYYHQISADNLFRKKYKLIN